LIIRLRRNSQAAYERTLLSPPELRRLLARERARTDRTGRAFSMLLFTPTAGMPKDQPFRRLLRLLKRRLRITDEIGILAPDQLAVVLPETPARGAWKVADDLLAASLAAESPHCEVFTYPGDWTDQTNQDPAESWCGDEQRPVQPMESLFLRIVPAWKRALDIGGSCVGLVLAAPLMLGAALAIRLTSPGPVLFRQWRCGAGNRPFLIYKLRTMSLDAESRKSELLMLNEQDGPAFKIKHDPRITPLGRWLRKTSIDELPQFWNVLRGDMSLVGPRPLPLDESANCARWQKRRTDAMPGLTCIWQVRGRSRVTFDDWVRMDVEYIRRASLWFDLKLLAQTVYVVLLRRGAY
jgi:lipopolysaccharide/colanic/teichoic acid biosynthesis glycosyltransferase